MTDGHRPADDELVSAYLDGEATPDELARVDADAALRGRVEELRALAEGVRSVPPPPAEARERHIARALQERGDQPDEASVAPVGDLAGARARRTRPWLLGAAAAVVAVVLAAGLLPSLLDDDNDRQTAARLDVASDGAGDEGTSDSAEAGTSDRSGADGTPGPDGEEAPASTAPEQFGTGGDVAPLPELGDFATRADLEAALARSIADAGEAGSMQGDTAALVAAAPCAATVGALDPELQALQAGATATLAGQPVEVLLFATDPASSANGPLRLYVIDARTCTPVPDGVHTITP